MGERMDAKKRKRGKRAKGRDLRTREDRSDGRREKEGGEDKENR